MVEIRHLKKKFENKVIFDDFNMDIPDGSFVVIHGQSGAGKTTLLNIIGGLEHINDGNVIVDGIDISKLKNKKKYFREKVGFLFQNFALIERKTVKQNLNMISLDVRTDISMKKALDSVGLSGYENKKVYTLSGGEQQRVALARLMMKQCSLILADEPTGSLDPLNSQIVMDTLKQMNLNGKTVIIVTHNKEIIKNATFKIQI